MSLAGIERWSGRVTSSIARARFNGLPQASRPAVLRLVERRAKWSEPVSTSSRRQVGQPFYGRLSVARSGVSHFQRASPSGL